MWPLQILEIKSVAKISCNKVVQMSHLAPVGMDFVPYLPEPDLIK